MSDVWRCPFEDCSQYFDSSNSLEQHKVTHYPANVKCYGCPRWFTTYYGMLIHLEAGTCPSGIGMRQVNRYAARCFQWKKYLYKAYHLELLDGNTDYRNDSANLPFKCPTCQGSYPKLSSLFQHIWSPWCEQQSFGGAIGKLKKWLKRNLKHSRIRA